MKQIRAFVAITPPEPVKAGLDRISQLLANQFPRGTVRWVRSEQAHITLRFIGNTEESILPMIADLLDETSGRYHPFSIHLDQKIGYFPNREYPRFIWVGLNGNLSTLKELKRTIDIKLKSLGWPEEERPFKAHLTLGWINKPGTLKGRDLNATLQPLGLTVRAIHLIESVLTSDGPIYSILHTSFLGGK